MTTRQKEPPRSTSWTVSWKMMDDWSGFVDRRGNKEKLECVNSLFKYEDEHRLTSCWNGARTLLIDGVGKSNFNFKMPECTCI